MSCYKKCWYWLLLLILSECVCGQNLSLSLVNVPLVDAIRLLARNLKQNVIINPNIEGVTSLELDHADSQRVMNVLLTAHGLAPWRQGNILYIGFQEEIQKQQQKTEAYLATQHEPYKLKILPLRYAKAKEVLNLIKSDVQRLDAKDAFIRADPRTNHILIYDSRNKVSQWVHLIRQLDAPIAQIIIEARVVSIDHDYEQALGINYGTVSEAPTEQVKKNKNSFDSLSLLTLTLADRSLLEVKLAALERAGKAELISAPTLFTENLQSAAIEAGEEVPYQEMSDSGGTAVSFKKAVLALRVTPQLLPGNRISLRLQINQDRPSNKMVLGVPTISTRQIKTSAIVKAGETIVLGGIYETSREQGYQGLPYLSKLPILGLIFKQHNKRSNKRMLLIFVTPILT